MVNLNYLGQLINSVNSATEKLEIALKNKDITQTSQIKELILNLTKQIDQSLSS